MEEREENLPSGVVHSKRIKAGKRTYFIDVKQTRQDDYFIALTESKKKSQKDKPQFIRHKVLIYKEDFNKILAGLTDAVDFIKNDLMPDYDFEKFDRMYDEENSDLESVEKEDQEIEG